MDGVDIIAPFRFCLDIYFLRIVYILSVPTMVSIDSKT